MTNYPVGDFLIRIKNAAMAQKKQVVVKNTGLIKKVADVLKKEGFLQEVSKAKGLLTARLAYRRKKPVILGLKLVSTPGLRIYTGVGELAKLKGPSMYIVSTSSGVMTSKEAIKKRLGGEVILKIW